MESAALYDDKTSEYFRYARSEILPMLPARADRVLEIGCGSGMTLAHLRATGRAGWTCGVEIVAAAAQEARSRVDKVLQANIETTDLDVEERSIDVVLALDVLEHLVDPWTVVRKLDRFLRPGGALVASIPNVRHHSVVVPLLFRGGWQYVPMGPLDRTHLRFFTRSTAIELVESSGMRVDKVDSVMSSRSRLVSKLTLSLARPFLEIQYLLRARKNS
jgi:2-polyprenyl-3-methyl-5-hydroxy-6-metoxy-1,4-benzoquinol methylase